MMATLLVRYGELGLKGKNRRFFEKTLGQNIKSTLLDLQDFKMSYQHRRLIIEINEELLQEALDRLSKVFGIASLSRVWTTPLDLELIKEQALLLLKKTLPRGGSFKVQTRRANKKFSYNTYEMNSELGAHLLRNTDGYFVDVHEPDATINVEIREQEAFLYSSSLPGAGGLPVGVTGKGLLLLSGGIDSPVAGWMAMKRGVSLEALHFHSPPFTGEGAREKVLDLCRQLKPYGGPEKLHLAPFTKIQKAIYSHCPKDYGVILMRRMMMRVATRLSARQKAQALFTGESLGQVASQTMESLAVVEEAAGLPIFRPLLGMDKIEIVNMAQKIGTFPISTRPYEDCCTLFLPPHPVTRPRLESALEAEKKLPVEELVEDCLENILTLKDL
ncbi:MAG: tRNA 4-thiouridine(8) synthase ThiI [Firmicutes bacterium]|nr:tRNA 4-thiouridine(8) synthase ThiI [Bacillota bacterium]